MGRKIVLKFSKSVKSKIPRDFKTFLSNGSNKTRMVQQIFEFIQDIEGKALHILRVTMLVLSSEDACKSVNLSTCELFLALLSKKKLYF